jgi:hypothetical protein
MTIAQKEVFANPLTATLDINAISNIWKPESDPVENTVKNPASIAGFFLSQFKNNYRSIDFGNSCDRDGTTVSECGSSVLSFYHSLKAE